jgi:hypothetical protein
LFALSAGPSAGDTAAGEGKRMLAVVVDNSELKVAFERSGIDGLPLHAQISRADAAQSLIWIKATPGRRYSRFAIPENIRALSS